MKSFLHTVSQSIYQSFRKYILHSINFVISFSQVSENQNCATILPFDRKEKQKKLTTLKMNKRSQGSRVYLKKNKNKKYDSKDVALDAKEFMGEFIS